MRTLRWLQLSVVLSVLAVPALAAAGNFDLSLHGGLDRYDAFGLKSGLGGVSDEGQLKDASTHIGATVIFRSGILELGAIGELGRPGSDGATTFLGALAGAGFDLGQLRLELLAEVGGHRYGDLLQDSTVVSRSKSEAWLLSAGVRPGLSVHFGPNGTFLAGLWAFARWDVTSSDVIVNVGGANQSTYELGGAQFGMALRLGVSL